MSAPYVSAHTVPRMSLSPIPETAAALHRERGYATTPGHSEDQGQRNRSAARGLRRRREVFAGVRHLPLEGATEYNSGTSPNSSLRPRVLPPERHHFAAGGSNTTADFPTKNAAQSIWRRRDPLLNGSATLISRMDYHPQRNGRPAVFHISVAATERRFRQARGRRRQFGQCRRR